ncbi:MAG: ammonia-forming cytochrome c nitrite reductase [Bacteroidetes bacterium]|nr:ammonia-forming cytochrome c nitrite reductase [Bacteroidota bacterium]MBL6943671.1 ammonia-forming cytochrome c nitrite reductase [Bacteroidales bacterium]
MSKQRKPIVNWIVFLATILVVFFLGLLASSIVERRAEDPVALGPQVSIAPLESRNELWGKNYPTEYESWLKTDEGDFLSKYNGNEMIDMLEIDPRLVVLWAGYGFAKDYNQGRGHAYAIEDLRNTLRTGGPTGPDDGPMPSTCWTCKSPDVPRIMNESGVTDYYTGKWSKFGSEIVNPIGCADCHNNKTMELQITRPALVEAFDRNGRKITDASHNEMRSLVCAQCHVEYYFDKNRPGSEGANYLTFPLDNGITVEAMEAYYDEIGFSDWTHSLSRAPMLKAQHPGWEVFTMGIHAERGVSCADCHMPYMSEGGRKYTDHHIQSPLNNIENSCMVCHKEKTETLMKNVYAHQDRIIENRDELEKLIVRMHVEAKTAWDSGASEEQMKDILMDIRHAQWRWDYAAASHGGSFHAPVEISRVIAGAISIAQEGRIKLAKILMTLGHSAEVAYPDIETKAKAQKFIGLPMDNLIKEKEEFRKNLAPKWDQEAKERESKLKITWVNN